MIEHRTKELEALESIQQLINDLPEDRRHQVLVYSEDIRDILSEGSGDAFLALTLVSLEFAATNAQIEKEAAANDTIIDG